MMSKILCMALCLIFVIFTNNDKRINDLFGDCARYNILLETNNCTMSDRISYLPVNDTENTTDADLYQIISYTYELKLNVFFICFFLITYLQYVISTIKNFHMYHNELMLVLLFKSVRIGIAISQYFIWGVHRSERDDLLDIMFIIYAFDGFDNFFLSNVRRQKEKERKERISIEV